MDSPPSDHTNSNPPSPTKPVAASPVQDAEPSREDQEEEQEEEEKQNDLGGEDDDDGDDDFGDDFDDFEEGGEDDDFDDFEEGFQQAEPSVPPSPLPPQQSTLSFVRLPASIALLV